ADVFRRQEGDDRPAGRYDFTGAVIDRLDAAGGRSGDRAAGKGGVRGGDLRLRGGNGLLRLPELLVADGKAGEDDLAADIVQRRTIGGFGGGCRVEIGAGGCAALDENTGAIEILFGEVELGGRLAFGGAQHVDFFRPFLGGLGEIEC